jgi:hypothetical protein
MENEDRKKARKALSDAILALETALESLKTAVDLLYETQEEQENGPQGAPESPNTADPQRPRYFWLRWKGV